MNSLIFPLEGNEDFAKKIAAKHKLPLAQFQFRHFPDGETFIKIDSDVKGKDCIIVCTLNEPDAKVTPLLLLAKALKEMGAAKVGLIAPYLAYMRQDISFHKGEAVTSELFAELMSSNIDWLETIDPHLHRWHSLNDIYTIPCICLHANGQIADYIKTNIKNPLLVGPDGESKQWVAEVASMASAPYIVLTKERLGDDNVKVSIPHLEKYVGCTPVLIDDIISTAQTMIEAVHHIKTLGMRPICIGIHAIFAGNAYQKLMNSNPLDIITCNTVKHFTNKIDVSGLITIPK